VRTRIFEEGNDMSMWPSRRSAVLAVLALGAALAAGIVGRDAAAAGDPGDIVFRSNRADGAVELYRVGMDGSGLKRLTFNTIVERQPVWSPDRARIAFAGQKDGNWDVYSIDAAGADLQRHTTDSARDDYPKWTVDGRIVFQRGPFDCAASNTCEGWIVGPDEGAVATRLPIEGNVLTPEPSPRGSRLAFASNRDGAWSIYVSNLDGRAVRRVSDPGSAFDFNPRWSPSGNDLAFLRDATGVDNDLYMAHADGTDIRRLTDTPDRVEFWPSWTPDGSEVIVTAGFGQLLAIRIADQAERAVDTEPRAPFVETFDDGVRDAGLWHEIVDSGPSIGELGGRLVIEIAGTAIPGGQWNQVEAHWGLQCTVPGDFDAQVDFELLEWPTPGGFYAGLTAIFADAGIWRHSATWAAAGDETISWVAPNAVNSPSTPTAGSLRVTRTAGIVRTYVRSVGADWTLVGSGVTNGAGVLAPQLYVPAAEFQHLTGRVAFDNFTLNSGELSCPTWWSDAAADA
jgi:hypothetical protein